MQTQINMWNSFAEGVLFVIIFACIIFVIWAPTWYPYKYHRDKYKSTFNGNEKAFEYVSYGYSIIVIFWAIFTGLCIIFFKSELNTEGIIPIFLDRLSSSFIYIKSFYSSIIFISSFLVWIIELIFLITGWYLYLRQKDTAIYAVRTSLIFLEIFAIILFVIIFISSLGEWEWSFSCIIDQLLFLLFCIAPVIGILGGIVMTTGKDIEEFFPKEKRRFNFFTSLLTILMVIMFLNLTHFAILTEPKTENQIREQPTTIIGHWSTEFNKGDSYREVGEIYFYEDGSGTIVKNRYVDGKSTHHKEDGFKWKKKDNQLYMKRLSDRDAIVADIRSIDPESLILHFSYDPDDKIIYFTRQ